MRPVTSRYASLHKIPAHLNENIFIRNFAWKIVVLMKNIFSFRLHGSGMCRVGGFMLNSPEENRGGFFEVDYCACWTWLKGTVWNIKFGSSRFPVFGLRSQWRREACWQRPGAYVPLHKVICGWLSSRGGQPAQGSDQDSTDRLRTAWVLSWWIIAALFCF